ncbi:hypothetical protein MN2019_23995 [Mycolicibacterium neoaurum]|uniref:hypothetical protein n=1 Tax=Mycolicibacterium neoaurum TaxID=1795 RepID=UPI001BCF01AC|nr:hypothetical protein [Mycolicibacterium neoaurum]QVI27240.1 hypothetical protein MN2019_23995 [Mycolicibacterium neoaurum]
MFQQLLSLLSHLSKLTATGLHKLRYPDSAASHGLRAMHATQLADSTRVDQKLTDSTVLRHVRFVRQERDDGRELHWSARSDESSKGDWERREQMRLHLSYNHFRGLKG